METTETTARLLRRLLRSVVNFYGTDIARETYWSSLQEGERSPMMTGSFESNPRDYAWEARNCPAVRDALSELVPHLDRIHGNRLIRHLGPGTQRLGSQAWATQEVLNSAVVAAVTGNTDARQIRRLADRLARQLTADSYVWRVMVPLEGLVLPEGRRSYRVSGDVKLRLMPLVEREMLLNADMLSLSSSAKGSIARSRVALEFTIPLAASGDLGHSKFNEVIDSSRDFVMLVSAVAQSDIRIAGYFAAPDQMYPLAIPFSQVPEMPIYEPLSEPFVLASASAASLMHVAEAAASGPNSKMARIAFTRLFEVMNHRDPAGRLIDAWIALESLFLADTNAELKFRAAIRIAGFSDEPNRQTVYDFVRKSYDTRSTLVHGGHVGEAALREIADGTVSLARLSLLRLLRQTDRFKPADIERGLLRPHLPGGR